MKNPETIIEDAFCLWLRDEYPFPALALKLAHFAGGGFPDRTVLSRGRIIFIEFKVPGRRLDPLQKLWFKRLRQLGMKCYVCTDVKKARRCVERTMGST